MLVLGTIALLLLAGIGAVSGRLSAAPVAANQTMTTFRFAVAEKGRNKVSEGQVLMTRASGSGTLMLPDTPQANVVSNSMSASGTLRFHGWRVVGGRVIEDANLNMDVVSGTYRFTNRMQNIVLQTTVTKSDPSQKYKCAMGSTGSSGLLDGKIKRQPDSFSTGGFCDLPVRLFGGASGARASVVVTIKPATP